MTGVKKLTGVKELTGVTRETSVTGASKEGEGGGNAVTAGIINPESPVNHWRHMCASAWTKLIPAGNLVSAHCPWVGTAPEPFDTLVTGLGGGEEENSGTDKQQKRKDRATQPMQ